MLNKMLEKPTSRTDVLYKIGRLLGIFPENSFNEMKYIFDDDSENEINDILQNVFRDMTNCGMIVADENDKLTWNSYFKVDSYFETLEKKKAEKARFIKTQAEVKRVMRKYFTQGEIIDSFGLVAQIDNVNIDHLDIVTTIKKVDSTWLNTFKVGAKATWSYVNSFGSQHVFTTESQLKSNGGAQNLLYIDNGKISFDKDS